MGTSSTEFQTENLPQMLMTALAGSMRAYGGNLGRTIMQVFAY
jgi:hypothetical protein